MKNEIRKTLYNNYVYNLLQQTPTEWNMHLRGGTLSHFNILAQWWPKIELSMGLRFSLLLQKVLMFIILLDH